MPKTYRPYDPDQELLLPPTVKEWVPAGDLAHFIGDMVDELDLTAITSVYEEGDHRGYPPYHPVMMTKLWLYAYSTGQRSSRKLAQLVRRDVGCMMLAAGNRPDFRTLNSFRLRHFAALGGLFRQVVELCRTAGLVKLGHVAIDGTRIPANASKHAAMSYERMGPERDRITREIATWFEECDRTDRAEDELYGEDNDGYSLPEQLRTAEGRRAAIRKAMEELEKEAREAGKESPEATAQRNFTDPESRIMRKDGAFIQGYNGQAAVDACSQVIVGHTLTNSAADCPQLVEVMASVLDATGELPVEVSADAGYYSDANLDALDGLGVTGYIATGRMPRSYRAPASPRGRIPMGLTRRERMKRVLMTKKGRSRYRLRQQVAEPVFGQMKGKGWERLWLRGLEKARGEWALHCVGHNILKLHKATLAAASA